MHFQFEVGGGSKSAKMLIMSKKLFLFLVILTLSSSSTSDGQQQYSGNSVMNCEESDETGPSPAFLYTYNGEKPSCKAFLMFRTQPPYVSLSSISNFTSSDPVELARINNITSSDVLPPDSAFFIPVTCSRSGQYYQANAFYVCSSSNETYFTIANETFQGLTSCNALKRENPYGVYDFVSGMNFQVPLRCACPTKEQTAIGIKFLLTFLVTWDDSVTKISRKFHVSEESVAAANGFGENPMIYPFTTMLIPLATEPRGAQLRQSFPTSFPYTAVPRMKKYRWLCVGVGTGAALALFFFLLITSFVHCRRKRTQTSQIMPDRLPENFLDKVVGIGETLKIYNYDEVEAATDNFSPQKRLGESIYHGILQGNSVAVKKNNKDVSKEIKILGGLNHFNIISLYGVCEHSRVFYLVYEFLEERSLKDWLCRESCTVAHSWSTRILIALDVASGLDYLHNFTAPSYVHKDINSRNILLNQDLRAKIANFSLARENRNSHSNTSCVVGEKGYMAPEYLQAGEVTPKIDVYAFGVVLLELITGKEAVFEQDGEEVLLSEAAVEADINGLVDPRLQVKSPLGHVIDQSELASRLLKLSFACLAPEPNSRLSMNEVVKALMKIKPDIYNPQSFSVE